ncbi:MAG: hypothetical protein AAF203_02535 [Pseudomonadota bacterium]
MRFYRIVLNLISSLSRNILGLTLGLVATPIILEYLGEERFGAYRVLLDWFGQLGLLEFGLFTALLPIFAKSLSPQSKISPLAVSREAKKKYLQVIFYQGLGTLVVLIFLDTLIPVEAEVRQDLQMALVVLALSLLFSFSQVYRAYLDSSQRGYILSLTTMVQNMITIGLSILAAYQGYGIAGQAIAFSAGVGTSFFILYLNS